MEVIYTPKIEKFVKKLNIVLAYRTNRCITLLESCGELLEMPISKPLGKGLFELRIAGDNHVRIFYCFHKNKAYLLHAIMKKQQALPKKDIEIARKVMKQICML